jgi:hypothetical protein
MHHIPRFSRWYSSRRTHTSIATAAGAATKQGNQSNGVPLRFHNRRPLRINRAWGGTTRSALVRVGVVLCIASFGVTATAASATTNPVVAAQLSGCSPHGEVRWQPSGNLPPLRLHGYTRTYCDDFRGREIGHGWYLFSGQPGGDPGAMFEPSHVTQTGGVLNINTYRDASLDNDWATGGLCQCANAQTYGRYFVRSRITRGGDDNDELLWPAGGGWPPEVDFNETGSSTAQTGSYVHYDTDNSQIAHQLHVNLLAWHTWGVIWTPTSLTFTVDGAVWGRVTDPSAIPTVAMTLDLQEQTFCYNGSACPTLPVSLKVDWVAEFAPTHR